MSVRPVIIVHDISQQGNDRNIHVEDNIATDMIFLELHKARSQGQSHSNRHSATPICIHTLNLGCSRLDF